MEVKILKCKRCGFVWGLEFIDPSDQPLGGCVSCGSVDICIVDRVKR